MAYTSSSSRGSSSRGSPSRGGSRGGSGGGNNMAAYAIAVVVLVLVIVLVVVMTSKKDKPAPQPTAPAPAPVKPAEPSKPAPPPYPMVSPGKLEEGQKLVKTFEKDAAAANKLYDESLQAKKAGDDALWQSKLKESRKLLEGIKDQWNDFIATLPSSKDYDVEEVAKHYFAREGGQVTKMIVKLAAMKSDER